MMRIRPAWPIVFLMTISSAVISGQEPQTDELLLAPNFSDDFSQDIRRNYRSNGPITWQPGEVSLGDGAFFQREITAGAWVHVNLQLELPAADKENRSEFNVWFFCQGLSPCFIRLSRDASTTVSAWSLSRENGKRIGRQIREVELANPELDHLTIEYRYGVLSVSAGDATLLRAYADKGIADVAAIGLNVRGAAVRVKHMVMRSVPPSDKITKEQAQLSQQVGTKSVEAARLYRAGRYSEAATLLQDMLPALEPLFGKQHPHYASHLANLADSLLAMRQDQRALQLYEQVAGIRKRVLGENHPDYAKTLNLLAVVHRRQGRTRDARPFCELALRIRKDVLGEQHPRYAQSLHNMATLYSGLGNLQAAEPLFLQALQIEKDAGKEHSFSYATTLDNLAGLYRTKGDFDRAKSLYEQALQLRKETRGERHPDYGITLNNLGLLSLKLGEFERALRMQEQAAAICAENWGREHPRYAASLNNLASVHRTLGDYERAESLYEQALQVFRDAHQQHPVHADVLQGLAGLYRKTGQYAHAETLLKQASQIREAAFGRAHLKYSDSLDSLASLYGTLGDFARAEQLYRESLRICTASTGEDSLRYAAALNNLGWLHCMTHDYQQAKPLFRQALQIHEKLVGQDDPEYASHLNNVAFVSAQLGEYTRATAFYETARRTITKQRKAEYATVVNNLAGVYDSMGDYDRAEPLHKQALQLQLELTGDAHSDYGDRLKSLAGLHHKLGDTAQAELLYRQAIRTLLQNAHQVVPSVSHAQAQLWISDHRPPLDRWLAVARRFPEPSPTQAYDLVWQSKSLLSRLSVSRRLPSSASEDARRVAAELRQAGLKLARLATASPQPDQRTHYRQEVTAASEHKETLEKQLAALNPATARSLTIRDAAVADLLAELPPDVAVVDFVQLKDWEVVDREITLIGDDGSNETRTVKVAKSTPVYDAFVLRQNSSATEHSVTWIPLGASAPIDAAISEWRRKLTGESAHDLEADSKKKQADSRQVLRTTIWSKLEPQLAGCKTVIVIPDGNLHRLPWGALPGRKPGTYLLEDYALGTAAYGQQLLGLLTEVPAVGDSRLVLASGIQYNQRPETDRSQEQVLASSGFSRSHAIQLADAERKWSYLRGSKQEGRAIRQLWDEREPLTALSGTTAHEQALAQALPLARYAHLATHGFFEKAADVYAVDLRRQSLFDAGVRSSLNGGTVAGRNPLLMTGLVLAGANQGAVKDEHGLPTGWDGVLTAEEIQGLDLRNTQLVTLSACETGLGDVAAGEGVFGLQRAFHQAGARTVVASLWKVEDTATRVLMEEFYKNLWKRKLGRLAALRQAQLSMLQRYDVGEGSLRGVGTIPPKNTSPRRVRRLNPLYWAAFQMSGDWR